MVRLRAYVIERCDSDEEWLDSLHSVCLQEVELSRGQAFGGLGECIATHTGYRCGWSGQMKLLGHALVDCACVITVVKCYLVVELDAAVKFRKVGELFERSRANVGI
jgi:hypothetical protein